MEKKNMSLPAPRKTQEKPIRGFNKPEFSANDKINDKIIEISQKMGDTVYTAGLTINFRFLQRRIINTWGSKTVERTHCIRY